MNWQCRVQRKCALKSPRAGHLLNARKMGRGQGCTERPRERERVRGCAERRSVRADGVHGEFIRGTCGSRVHYKLQAKGQRKCRVCKGAKVN